ncbi:type II toxin-antitoxin system RelE/ParE family toxin [Candidatus Parcubacteria bacterium]|nr:type II toxin-antitoxin system RelE/ParE family toxin [Candidatus Parcubacteria bacterium]
MGFNIYYHKSSSGRIFVKDYINSLDKKTQYEIFSFLQKFKSDYRFRQSPYCKKIIKDIFEIRIKVRDCYRILFAFMYKDTVILLHIFKKKTNKISKKDLELAINRLKLYE